jgi:putative SOS response-associated peptidase YedK
MCGRFTRNYTWTQIHAMYSLVSSASNLQPRFNICPTTDVDVVIRGEGPRALVLMRWGLIPGWWKKPLKEMRLATFNARAETVAEKCQRHLKNASARRSKSTSVMLARRPPNWGPFRQASGLGGIIRRRVRAGTA